MLGGMFSSCACAMCLRTVSEYWKRSPQMRQCHWSRAKMYGRHSGLFGSSLGLGIFKSCAAAAHAAPEGYTVSIGNTSAVHPVQYDVLKDFEAVSLLINGPTCAAVATWPSSRLPCAILV